MGFYVQYNLHLAQGTGSVVVMEPFLIFKQKHSSPNTNSSCKHILYVSPYNMMNIVQRRGDRKNEISALVLLLPCGIRFPLWGFCLKDIRGDRHARGDRVQHTRSSSQGLFAQEAIPVFLFSDRKHKKGGGAQRRNTHFMLSIFRLVYIARERNIPRQNKPDRIIEGGN